MFLTAATAQEEAGMRDKVAAVVVGSGPNGLAAAITIARAGFPVIVLEAAGRAGGGVRSAELTLPGFMHDICSAVYPLAMGSPFFRELPLGQFGLKWIYPKVCMAHPFDNEEPVILKQSVSATAEGLGEDFGSYVKWMTPFVKNWERLLGDFLGPFKLPSYPALAARFGWDAIQSAERLAKRRFLKGRSQALFAGLAAHSMLPLDKQPSAATGMMLAILGHAVGWPIPRGGAQNLTAALEKYLESLGGVIIKESPVKSMRDLPPSQTVFFDLTPRQMLGIRELRFPEKYRRRLSRYRYGPGVFKIDWALDGEIPWKYRRCLEAGTLHLGGSLEEIARSENQAWQGRYPEQPFVLLSQPSQFDKTRAPEGMQAV